MDAVSTQYYNISKGDSILDPENQIDVVIVDSISSIDNGFCISFIKEDGEQCKFYYSSKGVREPFMIKRLNN